MTTMVRNLWGAAAMAAFLLAMVVNTSWAEVTYRLGSGDKLRVIVFGEEELSGEFEVDGSGSMTVPLVGEVQVGGKTLREAEQTIAAAYTGDYLVNPKVNVEVLNYRPIFILGEVKKPGNYPYINGMTVLQAVSVAEGYTYRAKRNNVIIKRTVDGQQNEMSVGENEPVIPGDVIHVDERFF